MNCLARTLLLTLIFVGVTHQASADLTAFIGSSRTPTPRVAKGIALSMSLLIVGFEFEYSTVGENVESRTPSLQTGMFNIEAQAPPLVSGLQFYGTIGGGIYREQLMLEHQEINVGTNMGGGVKLNLEGPIGIRLDYRIFRLAGNPLNNTSQRVYIGLNVGF